MKTPVTRRPGGFTLIELLVVIAIIAVLASAGFAAGNAAIQKARKATALSTATAIESSVNNFFNEYGSMPVENLNEDRAVNTKTDLPVLRELMGIGTTLPLNTRLVRFLSVREGKANKNGAMFNTTGDILGIFDPWGGTFQIMLDGNYDERINPAPAAGGGRMLNGRRVAVWSNGVDGVQGGGKAADDVLTW